MKCGLCDETTMIYKEFILGAEPANTTRRNECIFLVKNNANIASNPSINAYE